MMDKLEDIFNFQSDLQERLGIPGKIKTDEAMRQQYINQMALAIHEETVEVLCATRYKDPALVPFGWKKEQKFDRDNFREEVVDLMHFIVNLALADGMTSKEFYDRYVQKNKENHSRIDNGQVYQTREEKGLREA